MSEPKQNNQAGLLQQTAQNNTKNNAVAKAKKTKFAALIKDANVQNSLVGTLGDAARTKTFTSSLISAVSTNPALQECEGMSIISAALLGESLNLSPSPQLGHYYMVPFKDTKAGTTKAAFVLGYKGYQQLAMRYNQYKKIEVSVVKEGELAEYDPIYGKYSFEPIKEPLERENAKTVGYFAYFELLNGFRKELYWPKEKMEAHALKYSKGYAAKKGYTFWEKDFDGMALKTMYRQLIGKYGIMSVEMQKAYVNDMTIQSSINPEDNEPEYFDAGVIDATTGEVIEG
ncbi:MAG: recombinase RecT [Lachnospiraceae bacterium]|nr:recombinase RecT [Lachnospiraceae bacterium]